MPRIQSKKSATRHDPLHHELSRDEDLAKYGRVSQPGRRNKQRRTGEDENREVGLEVYGFQDFENLCSNPWLGSVGNSRR